MIGINLINPSVLSSRRRQRRIRQWLIALSATGLLGAMPVGLELSRHQQVQSFLNDKTTLQERIESSRLQLNELGIEIRSLEARTARAGALRTKRSWTRMASLFSSAMPETVWLVSLATDPPAPARGHKDLRIQAAPKETKKGDAPEPPKVVTMEAPNALVFDGYALAHADLYEFMSRLKDAKVFADVSLTKASEEPVLSSKAVRFKLYCTW